MLEAKGSPDKPVLRITKGERRFTSVIWVHQELIVARFQIQTREYDASFEGFEEIPNQR